MILVAVIACHPGSSQAQSLISSPSFFNPDFEARGTAGSDLLNLQVDTSTQFQNAVPTQTAGNVSWTHTAQGLVQAGLRVDILFIETQIADVSLAAYTATQGNTLVFGRELNVNTLLGGYNALVNGVVSNVVGASAINQWNSVADVSGISLSEGVLYSASFNVATGAGLNLNALSSANFSLLSGGVAIENINSVETLNLLDLIGIGGSTTSIAFEFYAPVGGADELTFVFDADTIANVQLLGGISGNQTVMEFSNFSVAPVPEPGSLALASVGFIMLTRRRRFCRI
ncbi:putative secreted protein with PEP-CTERM sorting signal [Prosthecobacter fusiformis]|uniref:Putative secreted protein with PEP-CTERM sorting signal n=2 Tax=Prosthecobacter fusiformis TaxID=48464 RepID=A0A4R7STE3_9BACT|nr:putative secreted protein with PEP-CTERM sorting signal [Prosthecobacter fusiformis]